MKRSTARKESSSTVKKRQRQPKQLSKKHAEIIVKPSKLETPLICKDCNLTFSTNLDYAFHSKMHSEDGSFTCHLCDDYKHPTKALMEIHIRSHEGIKKYKCEVCNKYFKRSKDAVEHKFTHNGETPFQCEICGKNFALSSSLSAHRRNTHYEIVTGKPLVKFDCNACNKHYATHSGLFRHNSMHHKELGYDWSVLCDICGKSLSTKNKLKYHMRIHTGDKPHSCTQCSKQFSKKEQLKIHQRTHTGEKPFECSFCNKRFAQLSPYKYHIKTHTGERRHVCIRCKKAFISLSNMKIHLRTCNLPIKNEIISE